MRYKIVIERLLFCAFFMLVGGCSQPDHDTVIRISAFAPSQGWTVTKVFNPWTAELDQALGEKIRVDFFPGGSLGRHPHAQLDMVKDRIVDMAYIIPGYTPGAFPDNEIFEIPMLLPDARTASIASWRMLQHRLLGGYEQLKVLALFASNPYYLHLRDPIDSIDEVRGRKIRITGSMQAETIAALGAVPIGGISAPQLADSIDKGVIDGALFAWDLMHIYGVTNVTTYHVDYPLGHTNFMVAMNPASFASLPADARIAIDKHSGEPLIERFVAASNELANIGYQSAIDSGQHTIITLSSSESRQWKAMLQPLLASRKSRNARTELQLVMLRDILRNLQKNQ